MVRVRKVHSEDDTPQRLKFEQAARELGCDESEERFDAALDKIVKHKPPPDENPIKPAAKKPGR